MKVTTLNHLVSLDGAAFASVVRGQGYASAACYRLGVNGLVQIVGAGESGLWPAAVNRVDSSLHYTTVEGLAGKLGWERADGQPLGSKIWPKVSYLYFPEQALASTKLVLAVTNPSGKRCRSGELSAFMEVLASRLRAIVDEGARPHQLSDLGVQEHMRSLGLDMANLMDHELRTPLASVNGFVNLLKDVDPKTSPDQWRDYWAIVDSNMEQAVQAVEKLSLTFHRHAPGNAAVSLQTFDADEELRQLCSQVTSEAKSLVGSEQAARLNIRYLRSTDKALVLRADRRLFSWALAEVLRNAVTHARSGKVEVAAFTADRTLVIDIEDDGSGVAPGLEELIFLRFFRDPNALSGRKARRGMGLGLYLARQIAERHLGQLSLVKAKGRGTVFRFLWPLAEEALRTVTPPARGGAVLGIEQSAVRADEEEAAFAVWREGA